MKAKTVKILAIGLVVCAQFSSAMLPQAHASWFSDGINKIFGQSTNNSENASGKVKPKKFVTSKSRKDYINEYTVVTKTAGGTEMVGEWLLEIKEPSIFRSEGNCSGSDGKYLSLQLTDSVFDRQGNCIFGPFPYPRMPGSDIILDKGEYILRINAKSPGAGQSVKCLVGGSITPLNLNARRDIATLDKAQEIVFGANVRNAFFEKSKAEAEKDKYHYYTFYLSSRRNVIFDRGNLSYLAGSLSLLDSNGNFLYVLPAYVNNPAEYERFMEEQHYLEAGRYYIRAERIAERGKYAGANSGSAYCFNVFAAGLSE